MIVFGTTEAATPFRARGAQSAYFPSSVERVSGGRAARGRGCQASVSHQEMFVEGLRAAYGGDPEYRAVEALYCTPDPRITLCSPHFEKSIRR